ncbi:MAG TPA: hypothetical protein VH054_18245 [Polyangiaceae bacterium]|jgi:hypothetical protein|nr:hypothetical protein [Polyangiaceae bacterium]
MRGALLAAIIVIAACAQTPSLPPCTDGGAGVVVVQGGGCWSTYAIHCTDGTPAAYGFSVANVCNAGPFLWNTQKESSATCTIDVTCADDSTQTFTVNWVADTTPGCFRAEPQTVRLCEGVALDAGND